MLGMSSIGILLILYWQKREVASMLLGYEPYYKQAGHKPYYLQTIAGLFFGSLAALLAVILINGRQFRGVRTFFEHLIGRSGRLVIKTPAFDQPIVLDNVLGINQVATTLDSMMESRRVVVNHAPEQQVVEVRENQA